MISVYVPNVLFKTNFSQLTLRIEQVGFESNIKNNYRFAKCFILNLVCYNENVTYIHSNTAWLFVLLVLLVCMPDN